MCENEYIWRKGLKINSSPNEQILDRSKLKAIADDKLHVFKNSKFVLG